ncbi:MAG: hypothetical protein AB2L07_12940 [Thermoanaerobaculaceae bacterium]
MDVDACLTTSPDGNPDHAGQVQETDIVILTGGPGPRDYYMEKVDILIEARVPVAANSPLGPRVSVSTGTSLKEIPNEDYHLDKDVYHYQRFFEGDFYSSRIDNATGLLLDPFSGAWRRVGMREGKAVISLFSLAFARFDSDPGHAVLPTTPYSALVDVSIPGSDACIMCSARTGQFTVKQWVDERTRVRSGSGLAWVSRMSAYPAPDWLEARAFDYLVTPQIANDPEATEVFSRVQHLKADWDPLAAGRVDPQHPETIKINPGLFEFRYSSSSDTNETTTHYHGLQTKNLQRWDAEATISHEARHSWQFTLGSAGGRTDADSDYLYADPPASARELTDGRFDPTGSMLGYNWAFDFLADEDPYNSTNDYVVNEPSWSAALEQNAERFAMSNVGGRTSCATFQWQDVGLAPPPYAPGSITGRLSLPTSPYGASDQAGLLVSLEQAGSGTTCGNAGAWTRVMRQPTGDSGAVFFVTPGAGRYRVRLEPPLVCRTELVFSSCVAVQ